LMPANGVGQNAERPAAGESAEGVAGMSVTKLEWTVT
jgi:hypothetical protein